MVQSTHRKVLRRVFGKGRGSILIPSHFADLGTRKAVDWALARLVDQHVLHQLTRGIYYYPKTHPDLGVLAPDPDAIAKAVAGKFGTRLQPSGAYAANLLGLSTQVPAKIVYLTDGRAKTIRIAKQIIQLKHTTPKNMATAGRVSGLVIQAFKNLGKQHIDAARVSHLQKQLSPKDKAQLLKDIRWAPAWMHPIFRQIAGQ
jgi:hypothetical protein